MNDSLNGPCAGGDTTCGRCGYPARRPPTPPEKKIPLVLDEHTRPIWESAKRAAAEVAMWPAWKANECRCTPEELSVFMAEILTEPIENTHRRIASALAVPAHLLDPSVPTPPTALVVAEKCDGCNGPLGFVPTARPALCGDCDNLP